MFNIEDNVYHRRKEESVAKGHVTGEYSYMDPEGIIRVIKYNSTPETGFQAYGDVGVFVRKNNSFEQQQLPSAGLHSDIYNLRENFTELNSSINATNSATRGYDEISRLKHKPLAPGVQQRIGKETFALNGSSPEKYAISSTENHVVPYHLFKEPVNELQTTELWQEYPASQKSVANNAGLNIQEIQSTNPLSSEKKFEPADDYYFYNNLAPQEIFAFNHVFGGKVNDKKKSNILNYLAINNIPTPVIFKSTLGDSLKQNSKKSTNLEKISAFYTDSSAYKGNVGYFKTPEASKLLKTENTSFEMPVIAYNASEGATESASVSSQNAQAFESFKNLYFKGIDNKQVKIPVTLFFDPLQEKDENNVDPNVSLDSKHSSDNSQILQKQKDFGSYSNYSPVYPASANTVPYLFYSAPPLMMLHPGYRFVL